VRTVVFELARELISFLKSDAVSGLTLLDRSCEYEDGALHQVLHALYLLTAETTLDRLLLD
jgi:hypothetical protein